MEISCRRRTCRSSSCKKQVHEHAEQSYQHYVLPMSYDAMRDVCFATLPLLFAGNSLAIDGVRLCHQVIWSDTPRMVAQMAELRGPQYPAMSDHIHKSVSIEHACRLPGQLGTHAAICPTGTLPQLTAQLIWATVCEYFISHGQTKIFWKFL